MTENEIRRAAHALNALRPDWPISSLTTFIKSNLAARTYRDAVVALAWVAVDMRNDGTPASQTPRRVLEAGPWWTAAAAHDGKARGNYPPKKDQQCPAHPGQWADHCGGCAIDKRADDDEKPTPKPSWEPGDATAGADLVRAAMRPGREGL